MTDEELSPSGRTVSHFKNCKTCKEGVKPFDDYGWKALIHYADEDYIREEMRIRK